jgi:hypothetical protein
MGHLRRLDDDDEGRHQCLDSGSLILYAYIMGQRKLLRTCQRYSPDGERLSLKDA